MHCPESRSTSTIAEMRRMRSRWSTLPGRIPVSSRGQVSFDLANHPASSGHADPCTAQARVAFEDAQTLVHVERASIFTNNLGHAHLQGGAEVRLCHLLQPFGVLKQPQKLFRHAVDVVGGKELHRDLFLLS